MQRFVSEAISPPGDDPVTAHRLAKWHCHFGTNVWSPNPWAGASSGDAHCPRSVLPAVFSLLGIFSVGSRRPSLATGLTPWGERLDARISPEMMATSACTQLLPAGRLAIPGRRASSRAHLQASLRRLRVAATAAPEAPPLEKQSVNRPQKVGRCWAQGAAFHSKAEGQAARASHAQPSGCPAPLLPVPRCRTQRLCSSGSGPPLLTASLRRRSITRR